jgi:trehalose/maltose transport system substrate-binding protein
MRARLVCVLACVALLCACSRQEGQDRILLRVNVDPIAKAFEFNQQVADEFTSATGIEVELIKGPTDATERLSQYLQYLGAGSSEIDVYQVDVIWPGMLEEHLVDLREEFQEEVASSFEPIVRNNTVDERLVAIPWFGDAGMLYYRKDLLGKYGYTGPPSTWDELETMSLTIQQGERDGGNPDFWGYVWQGKAYEGLTCNALEWQVSHGGGAIIEPDGRVTVNNPQAVAAFARVAKWPGFISPPGVTTYQEEEARQLFQQGNAAFMRNWPYAYALANGPDSPVRDKFDVTVLPSGTDGRRAAALGGWQLSVSRYSEHQPEAIQFVKFMVSREIQKRRAIAASLLPARADLYDDPDIVREIPFLPRMKEVFTNASPRPSTPSGEHYNEVSSIYFQTVHGILSGQQTPENATTTIQGQLEQLLKQR